jgi:predicted dienelactone hydrolase
LLFSWLLASCDIGRADYDPLAVPAGQPEHRDTTITDAKRSRDIPIRIYLPGRAAPSPVVIFSHGLGGTRAGSEYLGDHWAQRGYVVVFVQHPGSDDSVWKDKPLGFARKFTFAA